MTIIRDINQRPPLDPETEAFLDLWAKVFVASLCYHPEKLINNKTNDQNCTTRTSKISKFRNTR